MIKCIFTIDYEIYGNGEGSMRELIYEPAERLMAIFKRWNARFVAFVEVAELDMVEAKGSDRAISLVKQQLWNLYREGFEIGLHLHPQWFNARYENGNWLLDYNEYNLCVLKRERIIQIIDRSLDYLRGVLGKPDFTPISFRAGNWLFQPTKIVAEVLYERGIRVDSSVFKGGLQHKHNLDYRRTLRNGYYWKFSDHVDVSDANGDLLELPIYTQMVPFWRMLTAKRIGIQQKASSSVKTGKEKLYRLMDLMRVRHPLKFDFCRMTINELTRMVNTLIREDEQDPSSFRPMVAIGHTKDLVDYKTVETFLSYLGEMGIEVSTFEKIYSRCKY